MTRNSKRKNIALQLIQPFKLTFYEIRKEALEDYEIKMIAERNRHYSEVFIRLLMQQVHYGEVR
ncbi:hypothetical protein [uncultured Ilyobacter sp.]|uniref:hypothetical protein n=1 Tax=uncultured Ilyobacter sp. TaxID=544433 RepID=UPI002AA665D2|nr:hypothetical protein [uncultured Ilyobacter sp.]